MPFQCVLYVVSCWDETLKAAPKDPNSERTSSFLGESLRFAWDLLFEWQTIYVCPSMVSAKKWMLS